MGGGGGRVCAQHGTSVGSSGEHNHNIFSLYSLDVTLYNCVSPAQNLATSLIMWVAVALYSPVLFILSAIGAVLGSFLPLIFLSNNLLYPEDSSDILLFQLLTPTARSTLDCGATQASSPLRVSPGRSSSSPSKITNVFSYIPLYHLHCHFHYLLSRKSFFAGLVNVVCTVFAQKSLARTLGKVRIGKY